MVKDVNDKRKELSLEYAGFWIRLAASLIDFIVLAAGIYILYCVISQSFFWIFPDMSSLVGACRNLTHGIPLPGDIISLLSIFLVIFLVGNTVYCIAGWIIGGQTIGKIGMGIKVIRNDSSPVDIKTAVIRFIAGIFCFATLGAGFMAIAFSKHKQGWHDKIADTFVVKLPVRQVIYDQSLVRGQLH